MQSFACHEEKASKIIFFVGLHTHMKGGVECVLAAMRTFTYDVEIQEYACGILSILAEQGTNKIPFVNNVILTLIQMTTGR